MSQSQLWLTKANLAEHGIKPGKAKYHAKTLEQLGLAHKTDGGRRGQWLYAPEAVAWLQKDRRKDKEHKSMSVEQAGLVTEAWKEKESVKHVAKWVGVSWYTAARWLDTLDLRPLTEGTMTNYVNRGKGD